MGGNFNALSLLRGRILWHLFLDHQGWILEGIAIEKVVEPLQPAHGVRPKGLHQPLSMDNG